MAVACLSLPAKAASLFAVQNVSHAGDNFARSTTDLWRHWESHLKNTLGTMGIECRFVDPADPENFRLGLGPQNLLLLRRDIA